MRIEKRISFYFFQGQRNGFLAKRTADFLEGEELRCGGVLDEVNVGETAFAEKSEDLEGAGVDAQVGGGGEAEEAVG